MLITLKNVDFSNSNLGTLNSWRIFHSFGKGVTYEGVTVVEKNASLTATITIDDNYEIMNPGISITINREEIKNAYTISGKVITISIPQVTGNVLISIPTTNVEFEGTIITDISTYERFSGLISSTNIWNNLNTKYQHIAIPISGKASVEVETQSDYPLYLAGLKTYDSVALNATPDFSDESPWDVRVVVPKGSSRFLNIPSDVNYLIIIVVNNNIDVSPTNIKIVMEDN